MSPSRWRLAARLARRDVRRRPGRTALVTMLVALPVAGMVIAVVLFRTDARSRAEIWESSYGSADAVIYASYAPGDNVGSIDPSALPEGSRVVEISEVATRVRTDDGRRSNLLVRSQPAGDPLSDGLVDLVAGRLPSAGDEVALSPEAAAALGVAVGDRLALDRPDIDVAVVGLAEDPFDLRGKLAVVTELGAFDRRFDGSPVASTHGLVDLPDSADPAAVSLVPGISLPPYQLDDRAQYEHDARVPWAFVVGALSLVVVGIVITAAFTAGARRQLTTLGQLSAQGAPSSVLRGMLGLQGTVTGVVGALTGVAFALAAFAVVGRERVEELYGRRLPPFDVRPTEIALAAMIGVVAATVAALVPARTVTRIPTLTAMAGRRPQPPVRRRVVVAGVAAIATGLALLGIAVVGARSGRDGEMWAGVAIAGGVLELLGTCAIAPKVASYLEPVAGRTRGAWRLASRSLARQRSRTGAVVSAVAAATGLAVAAAALVAGADPGAASEPELSDDVVVASVIGTTEQGGVMQGGSRFDAAPPPDTVHAEIEDVLPGAESVPLRAAGTLDDWVPRSVPVVADDAVVEALGLSDDVRDALDEVGLVHFGGPDPAPNSFGSSSTLNAAGDPQVTLPDGTLHEVAVVAAWFEFSPFADTTFIDPALADDLGLVVTDIATIYRAPKPLSAVQQDDLEFVREDVGLSYQPVASDQWLSLSFQQDEGWGGPSPTQTGLILAGVALVFSVLVVGASLALAAAEARDEREVMTVAGVGPGTLARGAGARAWLLSTTGAAMAVPAGLLPVAVFVAASTGYTRFVVPWQTLGVLLVALPLVAASAALVASTIAQRFRPVRISTAMFE